MEVFNVVPELKFFSEIFPLCLTKEKKIKMEGVLFTVSV